MGGYGTGWKGSLWLKLYRLSPDPRDTGWRTWDHSWKFLTRVVQLLKEVAENAPRAVGQAALEGQNPGYAKNTDMSSVGGCLQFFWR